MQVTVDPSHGDLDMDTSTGEYTYTPNANFNGSDSFTVKVADEHNTETSKVVQITVDPVNDTPEPENDGYIEGDEITVAEDGTIVIDVLANDYDVDWDNEGDSLTIQSVSGVDYATVDIINAGTALQFTPDLDYFGEEEFTYTVVDEHDATATANVKVMVDSCQRPADHFRYWKPDHQ